MSRSQLLTKLNDASSKKLIVINAPAGYGKSTLIADWLKRIECKSAWVSLDTNDNDLGQFLAYIVLSLKEVQKDICDSMMQLINSPQRPSPNVLINNLLYDLQNLENKTLLVLDDYHLIKDKTIHQAMENLIQNLPESLRMVIISRSELPFRISSLRAGNLVGELNIFDLKFNMEESVDFIKKTFEINICDESMEALAKKTDGWVSGLQLAALGINNYTNISEYIRSLSGDDRLIESYFIEEVFSKLETPIKEFLVRSSILDEFCPELCNYLLSIDNSAEIIETLEKANVFIIQLDNKKTWFRYHHLFSELLLNRLRNENPDQLAELYKRASDWYNEEGNRVEAIDYSIRAKDYQKAGDLIISLIPDYIARGGRDIFINWLSGFPLQVLRERNMLWTYYILSLLDRGTFKESECKINELWGDEKHFQNLTQKDTSLIKGYISSFYSSITNHTELDSDKALNYTAEAKKLLPKDEFLAHSIVEGHTGAALLHKGEYESARVYLAKAQKHSDFIKYSLMSILWWSYNAQIDVEIGNLKKAKEEIEVIIKYAKECGVYKSNVFSNAILCLGRIYFEWNDLEKAESLYKQGVELAESNEYADRLMLGYFFYIPYLLSVSEINKAEEKICKARELSVNVKNPVYVKKLIDTLEINVSLSKNDIEKANELSDSLFSDDDEKKSRLTAFKQRTLANYYLSTGKVDDCIELLQNLIEFESAGIRKVELIKYSVILAKAYAEMNNFKKGIDVLNRVLILAEPDSYIRTFIEGGKHIEELLNLIKENLGKTRSSSNKPSKEYVIKLLMAFKEEEERKSKLDSINGNDQVEKILTNREVEVIGNLALGLSYSEIADKMFISENTLRSHIKNIYKKLHVRNRTEAVIQSKKLMLI